MTSPMRPSTTSSSAYGPYGYTTRDQISTPTRSRNGRATRTRPSTARPRTGVSTLGVEYQQIICAVSESRGVSPTVGLSFLNLDTSEAVLCQISDSQTYVRTTQKLMVFAPSIILIVNTASNPKSKLFSIIEENLEDFNSQIVLLDRRYWADNTGFDYINQLAFLQDVETIKIAIGSNYFAVCCIAAVLKYVEIGMGTTFAFHSLRIKYEPCEGSMLIDASTIRSLELIQNLHTPKSRHCLYGILNKTLTPMGGRLLRSNILQPLTDRDTLEIRYDALEELTTKEDMFFATRQALKPFLDVDKVLTSLIAIPREPSLQYIEQSINNIIALKHFVHAVRPIHEAMAGSRSAILQEIQQHCALENVEPVSNLIDEVINQDTTHANKPLDLRNQRTYAVRSGVNGLLDVARQTYKEAMTDAYQHVTDLADEHNIPLECCYDNARQHYIRLPVSELEDRNLPPIFINVFRKKKYIECQTLDLMKRNQKIVDSHTEVLCMSDGTIQALISDIRSHISILFKICESIAMLDMVASFAEVVTTHEYIRPQLTDTLGIRAGRHPIREQIQQNKFIANDIYASQQKRFQIITGCNMSGKSTYIRTVALMQVTAQIGSFVPAQYASFPIVQQFFARISIDDNFGANVSTFAAEMRETAFILRNITRHSMVIIDELGRGTSTRDRLAIAIAIAEALVDSRALVWFATHFRELAKILSERNGVVNMHLAVDMTEADKMTMLYRLDQGVVTEQHYGLRLAQVLPLPPDVFEYADKVAKKLEEQNNQRQKASLSVIHARKRKLVLNLREQLVQAYNGNMSGEVLRDWLKQLQRELVIRMAAIDDEAEEARARRMSVSSEDDASSTRAGPYTPAGSVTTEEVLSDCSRTIVGEDDRSRSIIEQDRNIVSSDAGDIWSF